MVTTIYVVKIEDAAPFIKTTLFIKILFIYYLTDENHFLRRWTGENHFIYGDGLTKATLFMTIKQK